MIPAVTVALIALSAVLATAAGATAQPGGRPPQVGVLALSSETAGIPGRAVTFREGLRELGWIEGQNIRIRLKFANLSLEQLARLANELVQDRVDVIVAPGTDASLAASRTKTTIPIVMAGVGDPVRTGLVTNLARPGANITGVSLLVQELGGKRLELLREVLPRLSRVAVLQVEGPGPREGFKLMQAAAPRLGLEIRPVVFQSVATVADRFAEMRAAGAQALVVPPNPIIVRSLRPSCCAPTG